MCGIVGSFKPGRETCGPDVMARMRDAMAHRGPDGEGLWSSPDRSCTLGHRRLSIIDLSAAAAQPMLNAAGDRCGAEQHYRQAIAVAERQSAKLLQLRASTSLARLWRDQDRRVEARDLLAPIYGWFTEGFDAPVLKEAKALLDELV